MNIAFFTIQSSSGNNVYFDSLKQSLDKHSDITSKVFILPSFLEKVPFLIPFYVRSLSLEGFDIIHTNIEFAHFFKIKGKKLVATIHHINFDKEYQKYTHLTQKMFHHFWIKPNVKKSLRNTDLNIAVSHFTKESCLNIFGEDLEIKVIHNGIDLDIFKPLGIRKKSSKYRLLFIGNQSKRKGWDLVIEIMKKLGDNYELYYAGLRDASNKDLEKYNMFSLGKLSQEDLVIEYNKADLLLFPTRLEGFGYSVAESIACGTPVISTDYSSIPEIVQNGTNGYLCKLNDVDCFVEKIILCNKQNPFKQKEISTTIKEFNIHNLAKNYEQIYTSII